MSDSWSYIGEYHTERGLPDRLDAVYRTRAHPDGYPEDYVFTGAEWKSTSALSIARGGRADNDFRALTPADAEKLIAEERQEHNQTLARAVHVLVRALEDHDRLEIADKVRAIYTAVRAGTAPRGDLHALFPEIVLGDLAYPDDADARYRFRDAYFQALQMTQP